MATRERIHGVCAAIKRYSPITNLVLWVVTAASFVYLHYDLKRHSFQLFENSSKERMELFAERDQMIMRLMAVRVEHVTAAVEAIRRNADQMEKANKHLQEAASKREEQMTMIREILGRLPDKQVN